jgi:hypothetical protein
MVRRVTLLAVAASFLTAAPAAAITNGQPDNHEQPYVGELIFYNPARDHEVAAVDFHRDGARWWPTTESRRTMRDSPSDSSPLVGCAADSISPSRVQSPP